MANDSSGNAQSFLVAIGSVPLAPQMPDKAELEHTIGLILSVMKTDEYKRLAADRQARRISQKGYFDGISELVGKLSQS